MAGLFRPIAAAYLRISVLDSATIKHRCCRWPAHKEQAPRASLSILISCMQESERPIKDSAESMNHSGRKSLPMSSGSGGGGSSGMRDSGSQYRSSSGGIRGIMENLSQREDVSGQVSMPSTLLYCAWCAWPIWMQNNVQPGMHADIEFIRPSRHCTLMIVKLRVFDDIK